jgi:hypothetical protein
MATTRQTVASGSVFAGLICWGLLCDGHLLAQGPATGTNVLSSPLLSNPPEACSPVILTAINDPQTGKAAFLFDGREDPPVIQASPGEKYSSDIHERDVNAFPGTVRRRALHEYDQPALPWTACLTKCSSR